MIEIRAGQRFGKLVALERGDDYVRPNGSRECRWVFACDCGGTTLQKPNSVEYNVRKLGWASCGACYHASGGWRALVRRANP